MKWIQSIAVWLAASISSVALAQTSAAAQSKPSMPATVDASSAGTPTRYRSPFAEYVSSNDDKAVSWRDANALVGSIGGWRVYARESQQATPATPTPSATKPGPTPQNKQ